MKSGRTQNEGDALRSRVKDVILKRGCNIILDRQAVNLTSFDLWLDI